MRKLNSQIKFTTKTFLYFFKKKIFIHSQTRCLRVSILDFRFHFSFFLFFFCNYLSRNCDWIYRSWCFDGSPFTDSAKSVERVLEFRCDDACGFKLHVMHICSSRWAVSCEWLYYFVPSLLIVNYIVYRCISSNISQIHFRNWNQWKTEFS